jgi:uncharacterized integral membrane protein
MERLPGGSTDQAVEVEKKKAPLPRGQIARLVGLLVLVALIVSFVVQNYQDVTIRFWFVTKHPPLVFAFLGCLIIGGLVGYVSGRRRGARRTRRSRHVRGDTGT